MLPARAKAVCVCRQGVMALTSTETALVLVAEAGACLEAPWDAPAGCRRHHAASRMSCLFPTEIFRV